MGDALVVVGISLEPVVHALDYAAAAMRVPEVLASLQLPGLQPLQRRPGRSGVLMTPAEGHGRHSELLRQRRLKRGSVRASQWDPFAVPEEPRGTWDRSSKVRAPSLGATGAAHRTSLCSAS